MKKNEENWQIRCLKCGKSDVIVWTANLKLEENKTVWTWYSTCRWFRKKVVEKLALK